MSLKHLFNVAHSNLREAAKRGSVVARVLTGEAPRSPHWFTIEHRFKELNPTCAACGGTSNIQIHHKKPFHLHPELELADGTGVFSSAKDADGQFTCNLVTSCMSVLECHLRIFHGDNFKAYNPNVDLDAAEVLRYPSRRPMVEAKSKLNRLTA